VAKHAWTLTDVDRNIYLEEMTLTPADVPGAAKGYSVRKRTLRGGIREGVDVVEVDNGKLRFVVVPTRGMGLWNAWLGDWGLGWKSPVKGPVNPGFVRLDEASGIGWLDGFDELLVRCGLESNGAPEFHPNGTIRYGLHGKIANRAAHRLEVSVDGDSGEITVSGVVDEARLFGNKLRMTSTFSTHMGQASLTITDVVQNLSAEPSELELLYHTNFGVPLIGPGAKVVAPIQRMAPRDAVAVGNLSEWDTYGQETPGAQEACFFFDLAADGSGQTETLLHNVAEDRGVSLRFDKSQLPCFTLWKNRQAVADGYVTGLEPATNYPNRKSFEKEKGRVVVLKPGEARTFQVTMQIHPDAAGVAGAKDAIRKLQGGKAPQILDRPDPQWSAP
jgi:galactose mutarotase-like enzyme